MIRAHGLGPCAAGSGRRRRAASAGRGARILGVVLATVVAALGLSTAPAWADGADPTLVSTLTGVEPALPPNVLVQVRTALAPQLVVANPTPVPLTVLDPSGQPFVRVSASGVEGNVNSPFFHTTFNPPDAPPARLPAGAAPGAPVRWSAVSGSPEWGWFDPRLQPDVGPAAQPGGADSAEDPGDPAQQRITVLARWRIDLQYGATPAAAVGELQRRPVAGRFDTTVDPAPGLSATVVAGTVPAMYLQVPEGRTVEVLDRNGQPWLRAGPTGTDADTASAEYRRDRGSRGEQDGAGGAPGWTHLSDDGSSLTWLDPRLGWSSTVAPEAALRSATPTDLGRWTIPLRVDGAPVALTGSVRWLPSAAVLAQQGQHDPWTASPWVTVGLVAGGLLLAGALVLLAWRARRVRRAGAGPVADTDPSPDTRTTDRSTPQPTLEDHR